MKLIPIAQPFIDKTEETYIRQAIQSTWISSTGPFISQFEAAFANLVGVRYAISCSSGTSALHLALLALGIKPGDEVIAPNLTFVATANVIKYIGATPVLVDVTADTWTIDPGEIKKNITSKTRAIIPVHLYGFPADMASILAIARIHKLMVIEDAAEAHGARYCGKTVGSLGDIGCFSFYGNKIITTGEGGMLTTDSKRVKEKLELLKNHGMSKLKKYYHPVIGYNYRMTNIQAALGLAQLKKLRIITKKRQRIAHVYKQLIKNISGISIHPELSNQKPVCWLFSFLIKPAYGHTRDQLIVYLKKHGIDSRPFFYPLSQFPMYKVKKRFTNAELLSRQGISIPTYSDLSYSEQVYIASVIKDFARR